MKSGLDTNRGNGTPGVVCSTLHEVREYGPLARVTYRNRGCDYD